MISNNKLTKLVCISNKAFSQLYCAYARHYLYYCEWAQVGTLTAVKIRPSYCSNMVKCKPCLQLKSIFSLLFVVVVAVVYWCCISTYYHWYRHRPPTCTDKSAFSNGFSIGHIADVSGLVWTLSLVSVVVSTRIPTTQWGPVASALQPFAKQLKRVLIN